MGAQNAIGAVPAAITLPPEGRAAIVLDGTSGAIAASASDPQIAVTVDPQTHTLTVAAGTRLGEFVLHVSDAAGTTLDIPVDVRPPAGSVPARLGLTISGDPAAAGFLASRLEAAVTAAVAPTLAPGSSVHPGAIVPQPQQLERGFLTSFSVAVAIEPGPGTAPVSGSTTVDVVNAAVPDGAPALLAFADDPERIIADGVLSRTTVSAGQPTRLYYYHQNVGVRRRFCVVLSANDSVRTRVQLVGAAAGPNIDVMSVGHAVSKSFLAVEPHGEGVVATIVGGKPSLERDVIAGPGDGIVGALDLRVLDGGPVTATVMAIPLDADPAAYLYASKLPADGHTRHGSFAVGDFAQRIIAYSAGGPDAGYVYGSRQQTPRNLDPVDPGHDYGDYGVLQQIAFDLDNPGDRSTTVYLYEKPLGGVVRSSFVVNGTPVDLGCVRVPQRYLIAPFELAPHASGTLDVLTMTDGGSNYPLEIGVTTTAPLAATPPISAADGCFPKPGGAPAATQPADRPAGQ
ncbi:MAG: hypothetical protein ABSB70_22625 [Candidatus Velthaea sp.]